MISAMDQMEIDRSASAADDVEIFRLKGPFTLGTMFPFQNALRDPAVRGVVVDLSEVPYMDSAALGILLAQFAHAQRHAHKFAISGLSPRVRTIFEITHTDQVLPIYQTPAEAETSFAKSREA
jgi:anti-sigma B factor antagonist